jgi:7-dehydrocholesterol reductase
MSINVPYSDCAGDFTSRSNINITPATGNTNAIGKKTWGRCDSPSKLTVRGVLLMFIWVPGLALCLIMLCVNDHLLPFAENLLNFVPILGLSPGSSRGDHLVAVTENSQLSNSDNLSYLDIVHIRDTIGSVTITLIGWFAWQTLLAVLPDGLHKLTPSYVGGHKQGQLTPAGHLLYYNINGLQAWLITHITFVMLCYYSILSVTWIADNWMALFLVANITGLLLSIMSYLKAHYAPTHPRDNKYSGSFVYDFIMGVEFNPRIGNLDFKLFFNGRPGIIAWTLINISFAAAQAKRYGYVSDSMVLVNILQAIYVLDFFFNENWYLRTIDIAHDHFGWVLAWGDCVWLPFTYTIQAQYLSYHPVTLGNSKFFSILLLGLLGYVIFRVANSQKDCFRRSTPQEQARQQHVLCSYTTESGCHESKLLVEGLWGVARHMNYTGDIILSTAYCLACGSDSIIPYFYCIYMIILLVIRCYRDEARCAKKYGLSWHKYCETVPYRLIPYLY